ncbi:hypothetical protein HWV62_40497 [Athelia sp. TMB]|nr:hypothetical protein HWV62_40497 [Athelia sp. TMB]
MHGICKASSQGDLSGRFIDNGRLQLLSTLGSGGYGVVYLAFDTKSAMGKPNYYAVKCLQKKQAFIMKCSEVNLHLKLSSNPNILTIHHVIQDPNFIYLILDLCTGGNLWEGVSNKRFWHMDNTKTKDAVLQIIDAIAACHDAGVFHRDIKLDNFLCDADGRNIRLADFGMSTTSPEMRVIGAGTPAYLAPECTEDALGMLYSPREADVWALGVLIFELVNGSRPWEHADSYDRSYQRFLQDPNNCKHLTLMSHGVHELLKKVFLGPVQDRITLSDFRREFEKLDTIYNSEPEMASSSVRRFVCDLESEDLSFDSFEAQARLTNGAPYGITIGLPSTTTDNPSLYSDPMVRGAAGGAINIVLPTLVFDGHSQNHSDNSSDPEVPDINAQHSASPQKKRSSRFKSIIHRLKAVGDFAGHKCLSLVR